MADHFTLPELLAQGQGGYIWLLGHEEYGTQFDSTRVRTVDDGSLYTFKAEGHLSNGVGSRRPKLSHYLPSVLGEIRHMDSETIGTDSPGVTLYIRCPVDASPIAVGFFDGMISTLQRVMREEIAERGGSEGESWIVVNPDRPHTFDIKVRLLGREYWKLRTGNDVRFIVRLQMTVLDNGRLSMMQATVDNSPVLANDTLGVDYDATRDRTITRRDGLWNRYSYKSTSNQAAIPADHLWPPASARKKAVYSAQFVGQVAGSAFIYEDNPRAYEDLGKQCWKYFLKCPDRCDNTTRQLFAAQVSKLHAILDQDQLEGVGTIMSDWFTESNNVAVIASNLGHPWVDHMNEDSCVRVHVTITKDIRNGASGPEKIFKLWMRNAIPLANQTLWGSGVRIKLGCPWDSSPETVRYYEQQVAGLKDIIDVDSMSQRENIAEWVVSAPNNSHDIIVFLARRLTPASAIPAIIGVGMNLLFDVLLYRLDVVSDHALSKVPDILGSLLECKRKLWRYCPTLVGDVYFVDIEKTGPHDAHLVYLRCPQLASNKVVNFWRDQVLALTNIVDADAVDSGTEVHTSWVSETIADPTNMYIKVNVPSWYYTSSGLRVGALIAADVFLYRIHTNNTHLHYSLVVEDYMTTTTHGLERSLGS
ncbi:hypothetical protein B0H11DRAFT_2214758 [Mycena galericulata]|nr:hypothetical protein B0H11DRAFT_2244301 [Mycena galericulata]KAJ7511891.1 hypothetical protein B0H11DRAFT_2214758 [Mycena galericulata]